MADLHSLSSWWPCSHFDKPSSTSHPPSDLSLVRYEVQKYCTARNLPCYFLTLDYVSRWQTLGNAIALSNAPPKHATAQHGVQLNWRSSSHKPQFSILDRASVMMKRCRTELNIGSFCGRCSTWPTFRMPSDMKLYGVYRSSTARQLSELEKNDLADTESDQQLALCLLQSPHLWHWAGSAHVCPQCTRVRSVSNNNRQVKRWW